MDPTGRNKEILRKYIPESSVEQIAVWIIQFDFKLKIKKERSTKLGDYRPPINGENHQITINYNLNPYSFLITLVHEIAHLSTFNKFGNRVSPHGEEWKAEFRELMKPFLGPHVFPEDVLYALARYLRNPAAASCSDHQLLRVLKRYDTDKHNNGLMFLERLPYNAVFTYNEGRVFVKGEKIRTRFRCKEIATGNIYLFNPLTEVAPMRQGSVING